jgi:putative phosphotransacetylase
MYEVPIHISARHIHLSANHVTQLFGIGYQLHSLKDLSQPNQFAAQETVQIIGPKGCFEHVRVLGPSRGNTQLEISRTDAFTLGINPPVRLSGHIEETPGVRLQGPAGEVQLECGVIIAARHIHLHTKDAEAMQIQDQQIVQVKIEGMRSVTFHHVICRVSEHYALDMHIDTDEANAAAIQNGDKGIILVV